MPLPLQCASDGSRLVSDQSYSSVIRQLLTAAELRALCTVFIVDIVSDPVSENAVMEIVQDLEMAAWRGADTRLLIGGSRTNLEIAKASQLARDVISQVLPCRWLTARRRHGSHAKAVVADDFVLLGSHNWSPGAMSGQIQDSVLVHSGTLAAVLANQFEEQWMRADDHV